MKNRSMILFCLLSFVFLVYPLARKNGLKFKVVTEHVSKDITAKAKSTFYWWNNRWKENSEDGAVIFDLKGDRFYIIDSQLGEWTGGEIESFLSEMEIQITNLIKKVRYTYGISKSFLVGKSESEYLKEIRVINSGEEKVNGKKCVHLRIYLKKELVQEIWYDPGVNPSNYFNSRKLLEVLRRFSRVSDIFSREFQGGEQYLREQAIRKIVDEQFVKGLEMRSFEYHDGVLTYIKNTSDISSWKGDDKYFIPDGSFKKVSYHKYLEDHIPTVKDFFSSKNMEKHHDNK